jgi:hypothetical protein
MSELAVTPQQLVFGSRWGDKGKEMELVPIATYIEAINR